MITGLKGLAADGHEINCRTCRSGKTCNVANAHGYWVGACVRYSPEKPMTNADKIQRMSDEDLADFLDDVLTDGWNASDRNELKYPYTDKEWLDWLTQEVESDG